MICRSFRSPVPASLSLQILYCLCIHLLLVIGGCSHPALERSLDVLLTEKQNPHRKPPEAAPEAVESDFPRVAACLTLEKAVEEALKASPELDQMERRMEAASQQIKQVEATLYPRIHISEDYNVTDNPVYALMHIINQRRLEPTVNFNDPGRQQDFSTRIQGQWSLFEGGSRWYDRKAAVKQHHSTEAELMAARNRLVAKVAETYYQWLQALNFIGVAEETLESARTDERLGEARLKVEMALPSDIARLKARTAEVEGNLVMARSNARRLQAALERFLARDISSGEIPDSSAFGPSPTVEATGVEDPDLLVKQAMEKRPEMAAVKAMIAAAFARVKSAQGGFLPRLAATGQVEWNSEDLGRTTDSWMIGLQASLPLFEGGLTLARLREARARLREMEARGEQVALDIALEVRQAALTVREVSEKIRVQDERRKWACKALEEIRHQYRNEVAGVDSLLQAQVAWNQAAVAYTAAIFEGRIAQALLRQSLGDFADGIL